MSSSITIRSNSHISRSHQFEKDAITCSLIEIAIRNVAQSSELRKYIRVSFDISGNPLFCGGQIMIRPEEPYSHLHAPIPAWPFDLQPACEPQIIKHIDNGLQQIINGTLELQAKFPMLRAAQFETLYEENIQPQSWNRMDIETAKFLAKQWSIKPGWDSVVPEGVQWVPVPLINIDVDSNAILLQIYDEREILSYRLEVFHISQYEYAVIPVMFSQNKYYPEPLRLYMPPRPPYTLLGVNHLKYFPDAPVYITDDLVITSLNPPSPEGIFLFNPGGEDWIEDLDLNPLKSREVYCLTTNPHFNIFKTDVFSSGVKLINRFHSIGISPKVALVSELPNSPQEYQNDISNLLPVSYFNNHKLETLRMDEFIKEAQKAGVHIPDAISLNRHGEIDTNVVKDSAPLIDNLLDRSSITTIIEHDKVPQSMISPIISSAVRFNLDPFENHWKNQYQRKKKCIVFIDIEQKRRYLRQLNLSSPNRDNSKQHDETFLFSPNFLNEPSDDGVTMLNSTMLKYSPHVVIFDSPSIWERGSKNINMMRQAIRHCIENGISVVLILRNERVLRYMPQPDRLVNVWSHPSEEQHYIVETKPNIGEGEIAPFEFWHDGARWISETLERDIIDKIHERKTIYDKPGIAPDMDDIFSDLTPSCISDQQ